MPEFPVRFLIAAAVIVFYYKVVVSVLGPLSRRLAHIFRLGRRYPLRDVSAVLNLPVAALAQAVFCLALLGITDVEIWPSVFGEFHPMLLLYGVLVGVGEMGVATFLCRAAMQTAASLTTKTPGLSTAGVWATIANGGWMRYHIRSIQLAPLPVAAVSILMYVSVEEIIFRGILLEYFETAGTYLSLAGSLALFVLVQIFHMPDWRAAMFPVIGAVVMGSLHGALFLAVPAIIPLVVAHLVFFFSAIL